MSGTISGNGSAGVSAPGVVTRLSTWAQTSLGTVDVGTVALFLVLAVCAAVFWSRVLKHVARDMVMEVT